MPLFEGGAADHANQTAAKRLARPDPLVDRSTPTIEANRDLRGSVTTLTTPGSLDLTITSASHCRHCAPPRHPEGTGHPARPLSVDAPIPFFPYEPGRSCSSHYQSEEKAGTQHDLTGRSGGDPCWIGSTAGGRCRVERSVVPCCSHGWSGPARWLHGDPEGHVRRGGPGQVRRRPACVSARSA